MDEFSPPSSPRPPIIVITGPTATGKSRTALELARKLTAAGRRAVIISMDAVQVYRFMDIGTDKLPASARQEIPHYLIDVVNPDETFSAAEFARLSSEIIQAETKAEAMVILTGGTGFYLRALLWGLFPGPAAAPEVRARLYAETKEKGLSVLYKRLQEADPESARRIHPHDHVRIVRALEVYEVTGEPRSVHFLRQKRAGPRYHALILGLALDRQVMYERINARVHAMLRAGLIAEVEGLRARGYGPDLPSQQALGYKQIHQFLDGMLSLEEAVYLIQRDTRHYARRQLTWLRREPGLIWVPAEDRRAIFDRAIRFLEEQS